MHIDLLEEKCLAIYDQSRSLLETNGDVVKYGLNILYGPPVYRPAIFIVTFQGAGAQPLVRKRWPEKLLYDDESKDKGNRFGDNLRAALSRTKTRYLLKKSMASCVVFPQAPQNEASKWKSKYPHGAYKVWRDFSIRKCMELITLTEPTIILTFGEKPFEWINKGPKQEFRRPGQSKIVKRYGQFGDIRIIGSAHLSQGVKNSEIDEILLEIKQSVEA